MRVQVYLCLIIFLGKLLLYSFKLLVFVILYISMCLKIFEKRTGPILCMFKVLETFDNKKNVKLD